MKKFLAIFAVAGLMTACNNGSDETKTGDSTVDTMTAAPVTPAPDTTHTGDSTHMDSSSMKK